MLADRFYLGHDSLVFFQDVKKFVVVHFELFFLEKDNSGTFWDGNTLSVETFGLSDELHDVDIEVDIEFLLGFVSDDQSGLEGGFGSFDFLHPKIIIPHFVNGQHFTQSVVVSIVLFDFS